MAPPARAEIRARRRHTLSGGLEHLDDVGLGERLLAIPDARPDGVPGKAAPDENDQTLASSHARSPVGEPRHFRDDEISGLRARTLMLRGIHGQSL